MKHVGIVGHRSWIGQALAERIREEGKYSVYPLPKAEAALTYSKDFAAIFIIPGKLGQTAAEMVAERDLVRDIAASPQTCQRQVLLSSMSAEHKMTEYGAHKYLVELAFQYGAESGKDVLVVRPGAIFGPGQDLNAPMLIPQVCRDKGTTELLTPYKPTKFISVNDLTRYLVGLLDRWYSSAHIPGTFEATPQAIKDLYLAFNGMRPR